MALSVFCPLLSIHHLRSPQNRHCHQSCYHCYYSIVHLQTRWEPKSDIKGYLFRISTSTNNLNKNIWKLIHHFAIKKISSSEKKKVKPDDEWQNLIWNPVKLSLCNPPSRIFRDVKKIYNPQIDVNTCCISSIASLINLYESAIFFFTAEVLSRTSRDSYSNECLITLFFTLKEVCKPSEPVTRIVTLTNFSSFVLISFIIQLE